MKKILISVLVSIIIMLVVPYIIVELAKPHNNADSTAPAYSPNRPHTRVSCDLSCHL